MECDHFEYLMKTYLYEHGGWRWDERRGWTEPRLKGSRASRARDGNRIAPERGTNDPPPPPSVYQ